MSDDPRAQPEHYRPRRGSRFVGPALAVAIIAVLVSVAIVWTNRRREQKLAWPAQRSCPHAISSVGLLVHLYANEHGGAVPPDLDALQRYAAEQMGPDAWKPFTCEYSPALGVPPAARGPVCASWYVYVVPPAVTRRSQLPNPVEAVCAYESLSNHGDLGMEVLYWDGHVRWLGAPEARRVLDELAAGHNPPRTQGQ